MKNLFAIIFLSTLINTSFAGYDCIGPVDKWGACAEHSPVGQRFYTDGLASCLHPCTNTEEELIEIAKINAQKEADFSHSCGYQAVRSDEWENTTLEVVTEGTKTWTVAKIGAIFTCQR